MRFSIVTILILLICSAAVFVQAEIPQMISYQGKVTDISGMPVADGSYVMRFQIYDAITGGALLWDSGARLVSVLGGIFSVVLGESPQPEIELDFVQDYWLEVSVSGDVQTPRSRLSSVGYAYMASGIIPGTEIYGAVDDGTFAALKCVNASTSGERYGLLGISNSTEGRGVFGWATANAGAAYGVVGQSQSTQGAGVYGTVNLATGPCTGVLGTIASTEGYGVRGEAVRDAGVTYGVYGVSASSHGFGVYGLVSSTITGTTYAVFGEHKGPGGSAICGNALSTTGSAFGGRFTSASNAGTALFGSSYSSSGITFAVRGLNESTDGTGVCGYCSADEGPTVGVMGMVSSTDGLGVYSVGDIAATGSKSAVVRTSRGATLLYCQESPECWFEDFGHGQVTGGQSVITLDRLFLETVTINDDNPMMVFITPNEDINSWWVKKGSESFVLCAPSAPEGAQFDYRVVAKRRGFETRRLEYCPVAEKETLLYPELHKSVRYTQP